MTSGWQAGALAGGDGWRRLALSLVVAVAFAVGVAALAPSTAGARIYWTNYSDGLLGRADLDGSKQVRDLIDIGGNPAGVAVHGKYVYWTNAYLGTSIGRATRDGRDVRRSFITGASSPEDVVVHDGHIYWVNRYPTSSIGRADLDGSNVDQEFITGIKESYGMAIEGRRIYWADYGMNSIGRANLDGSHVRYNFIREEVATHPAGPVGIAANSEHLYWTNLNAKTVARADLNGGHVNHSFLPTAAYPHGIALTDTHVYWVNTYPTNTITRAKLDGSALTWEFMSLGVSPSDVAVAPPEPGHAGRDAKVRCDVSGQKPEVDCTTTFSDPELESASWRLMSEGKRVARGEVALTDTHFELRLDTSLI